MFTVELASYGLKCRSEGFFTPEASQQWGKDYAAQLQAAVKRGTPFGQYVDLRGFKPGAAESQQIIGNAMKAFKEKGGQRSAVVLDTPTAVMQIKRLGKESGIYAWERYFDPQTTPNFEKLAIDWLVNGTDPDKK